MKLEEFSQIYKADYISSRTNPRTVGYGKLSDRKYRERERLFLAEGVKLTEEALCHAQKHVQRVLLSQSAVEKAEENGRLLEIAKTAKGLHVPVSIFADSAFEKISTESAPQGVIAVLSYLDGLHEREDFSAWQKGKRLIMLEEIRDPGNLGTILRSAEALGADGVILSGCADLYGNKVVRSAMGSLFRMPAYITSDGQACVKAMKKEGRRVLAAGLGEHTMTLGQYETDVRDCVVIGNEGHGISKSVLEECNACVRIPMAGRTESLNASVAAACILWEYFRSI